MTEALTKERAAPRQESRPVNTSPEHYTTDLLNVDNARALFANYPCCFIKPGSKAPEGIGWQENPRSIEQWRPGTGVGVICGEIPEGYPAAGLSVHCLDVDTPTRKVAEAMQSWLAEYLYGKGEALKRTGKPPKFAVPFVCRETLRKTEYTTARYYPPGMPKAKENAHQLEVLGAGNQFVAYGIHPDTERPYQWGALDGITFDDTLHATSPADLVELSRDDLVAIKAAFERIAEDCGLVLEPLADDARKRNSAETEHDAPGYTLAEVLPYLRNSGADYDDWQRVGAAIKQAGGSYDDWLAYSRQCADKHDETEMPRKWQSFEIKPGGAGMGTLARMALQAGMPSRREARETGGTTCPGSLSDASWPALVSLDTAAPPRLPINEWPEPLRSYALTAAAETETPPELPAMLALGVFAAAAQKLADVEIKPGYREPINIYTVVALPPAARKSAEFKRATKPLVQWEAKQREAFADDLKRAESLLATHKDRVKALRAKAAKSPDDAEAATLAEQVAELEANEPGLPKAPRVFTSDVTTEHLATMMSDNGDALAVMSSEGGIFETMAGRYSGNVANIDLYLQAHAADAVRVERGSKPPALMDSPRLTMALAVQPDVLEPLSNKPGFRGRGLLGRVLYVVPPSTLGDRTGDTPQASAFVEIEYHRQVKALLDATRDDCEPGTLTLSPEARELWSAFWAAVEAQLGEFGRFHHMTDWAGKLPGAVARMAALFHLSKHGPRGLQEPIGADCMAAAVSTGEALAGHAMAVYGLMGADPDIESAKVLVRWIRRHDQDEFTARDAHSHHRSRFPRAADLDGPLAVLVERGYVAEIPQERGQPGRPSRAYLVNPAVHA